MAISERRRLTFTTIVVTLLGTFTAFILLSALMPSTASTPILPPGGVLVYIQNNSFPADSESGSDGQRRNITVQAGTTVIWNNLDLPRTAHTITSIDDLFDSGSIAPFSYTFIDPGVYNYRCTIHGMRGRVTVL